MENAQHTTQPNVARTPDFLFNQLINRAEEILTNPEREQNALDAINQALTLKPRSGRAAFIKASILVRPARSDAVYEDALALLLQAEADGEGGHKVHFLRGEIFFNRRNYATALHHFAEARRNALYDSTDAAFYMAACHHQLDEFIPAQTYYLEVITTRPNDHQAYAGYADLLQREARRNGYEAREQADLTRRFDEINRQLENLMMRHQRDLFNILNQGGTLEAFLRGLDPRDRNNPHFLKDLAVALLPRAPMAPINNETMALISSVRDMKKEAFAFQLLSRAIVFAPNYAEAILHRGFIYMEFQNDFAEAQSHFETVVRVEENRVPNNSVTYQLLGAHYYLGLLAKKRASNTEDLPTKEALYSQGIAFASFVMNHFEKNDHVNFLEKRLYISTLLLAVEISHALQRWVNVIQYGNRILRLLPNTLENAGQRPADYLDRRQVYVYMIDAYRASGDEVNVTHYEKMVREIEPEIEAYKLEMMRLENRVKIKRFRQEVQAAIDREQWERVSTLAEEALAYYPRDLLNMVPQDRPLYYERGLVYGYLCLAARKTGLRTGDIEGWEIKANAIHEERVAHEQRSGPSSRPEKMIASIGSSVQESELVRFA